MTARKPNSSERIAAHVIVGLAVGALFYKKSGFGGSLLLALLAVLAHEALDAPLAQLLAELAG